MESGKTLHKMQCWNHSKNWRNLADTWASDTVTCDDPRVDLKELSAARTIWLKVLNILHILPFLTGFYLSPGSFRETAHSLSFYNTFSSARSAEQTIFSDEIVCIKVPLKLHSLKYGNLSRLCAFLDTDCFNRKKKKSDIWPPFQLLWSFVDTGKIYLPLVLGLIDIIMKIFDWMRCRR